MPANKDLKAYYRELGVQPDASQEDIQRAYRRLAKKYHPDRNPGDSRAEERFKAVSEAWRVLRDPQTRLEYHQKEEVRTKARQAAKNRDTSTFSELFKQVFKGGFGSGGEAAAGGGGGREYHQRGTVPRRGANLQMTLELDPVEMAAGASRTVRLTRDIACKVCDGTGLKHPNATAECNVCQGLGEVPRVRQGRTEFETCPNCKGAGSIIRERCMNCGGRSVLKSTSRFTIDIPQGSRPGETLTVPGQGNAGAHGGRPGDLRVTLKEADSTYFETRGEDVLYDYPLTLEEIALGGEVEVPAPRGKVKLNVEPGLPSGKVLRIKGKGLPKAGGGQGDLLIRVNYHIPDKVSSKAKKLLEELMKQPGWSPPRDKQGFVRRGGAEE